jgi:hypothetical protein
MDITTASKILLLKYYLASLPHALPLSAPDSKINALLNFSPDEGWVADVGEECPVNRELEAAIFQFGSRNAKWLFNST